MLPLEDVQIAVVIASGSDILHCDASDKREEARELKLLKRVGEEQRMVDLQTGRYFSHPYVYDVSPRDAAIVI